jgi:hypothetical protein
MKYARRAARWRISVIANAAATKTSATAADRNECRRTAGSSWCSTAAPDTAELKAVLEPIASSVALADQAWPDAPERQIPVCDRSFDEHPIFAEGTSRPVLTAEITCRLLCKKGASPALGLEWNDGRIIRNRRRADGVVDPRLTPTRDYSRNPSSRFRLTNRSRPGCRFDASRPACVISVLDRYRRHTRRKTVDPRRILETKMPDWAGAGRTSNVQSAAKSCSPASPGSSVRWRPGWRRPDCMG